MKAFNALDQNRDKVIDTQDIVLFLKQHFIRIGKEEAELVIKEYDSDKDNNLNIDEFKMLFMPTTNEILRDIANRRGQSLAYEKDKPLVEDIAKLMASHIELELSHLKKRNEIKRQLLQTKDFSKQKAFN